MKTKLATFNDLIRESLFHPGGTLTMQELKNLPTLPYCTGKYNEKAKEYNTYTHADNNIVWYNKGKDDYSSFYKIQCFNESYFNDSNKKTWEKIKRIIELKKGK